RLTEPAISPLRLLRICYHASFRGRGGAPCGNLEFPSRVLWVFRSRSYLPPAPQRLRHRVRRRSARAGRSSRVCRSEPQPLRRRSPVTRNMRRLLSLVAFCAASVVAAQQPPVQSPLLDHLAGKWVLQGTIAGQETTHDVDADWVLDH